MQQQKQNEDNRKKGFPATRRGERSSSPGREGGVKARLRPSIPMGDWSRSEMMCSHEYEKEREQTKGSGRAMPGVGACHPAGNESFLLQGRTVS